MIKDNPMWPLRHEEHQSNVARASLEQFTAALIAELHRESANTINAANDDFTLVQVNDRFNALEFARAVLEVAGWRASRMAATA